MQIVKYFMLLLIFISSSLIGKYISKKYTYRLKELEEFKNILNVFKSKIRFTYEPIPEFTYEPIPEIFREIANNTKQNIAEIFEKARKKHERFECWTILGKGYKNK